MKKSLKLLFCATALASLAGCNKFDEADTAPDSGNGSLIKVYAKVAENDGTRANIHVGESAFTAEWEAGDALGILPVKTGGTAPATAAKFDYNTTSAAFEGSLNDFAAGGGNYYAFFPHAKVTGTTANLPFGNLRTQAGNDFNSAYDALVATPRAYTDDDEAGKADGKDVTFTLHRLTSILNFSIATPADKVKYLLLTAGGETQKLSASSLDFSLKNGGAETVASLSTTDQSNVIALQYTPDAAGGDHVEAFFNVPADLYPTLTLDVIDSDNQMATVTVNRTEAFKAGTLYKKAVDAPQFAPIAAPSLVWPNQDMNEPHDITKCGTDYEANIQITVPGGIAGLMVNITSEVLNEMELKELDLFSTDLGLPGMTGGVAIQYQKSTTFDITTLVPLIASLKAAPGSEHIFEVVVTDLAGQQTTQRLTFYMPSLITYNEDADLWLNTASFTLKNIPAETTSVSVQYKKSTETAWQTAEITENKTKAEIKPDWGTQFADDYDLWANTVTLRVVSFTPGTTVQFGLRSSGGEWQPMAGTSQGDDFITATYAPQWVPQTVKEQTVYTQAAGTGIIATHSYDFRAIINGTETTGTFTAGEVQPIPNGDMSGWSMTGGFAFPNAAGESFWSSGNNTMTKTLCTSTDVKFGKSAPAAKLTSTNMLVLAAGNLFTGEFAYKSFTGTVQFGQTYAFTARPSAMKVKYHAHVGTVDKVRTSGDICPYIKKGDPDMARIFVAIVDWNAPHEVVSGMTTTKGAWDPEKGIDNVSEGKILGYGSLWITQSTDGEDMQDAELDIVWYDHETRPAEGKYSLVISCACNAYGDYFTGCSKNVMYVDDFEWVY